MANKIRMFDGDKAFLFFCPGCGNGHMVTLIHEKPCWTWNGSYDRPTISPSYLVQIPASDDGKYPALRCHSYIRDGKIEFLSDSLHHLSGQTVELPDWEE